MKREVLTEEMRAAIREAHPRAVMLTDPEEEFSDLVLRMPTAREMRSFGRRISEKVAPRSEGDADEISADDEEAIAALALEYLPALKLFPDADAAALCAYWPELELSAGDALTRLLGVRRVPKALL